MTNNLNYSVFPKPLEQLAYLLNYSIRSNSNSLQKQSNRNKHLLKLIKYSINFNNVKLHTNYHCPQLSSLLSQSTVPILFGMAVLTVENTTYTRIRI